ncbi:MAG TPA: phosphate/phosphite/phosphonate ABC transporter substrate-binding protein, partial [Nitrospirae bacterium]|nr:phosphate/phosphite/phosphonate ABC transporter substrate-binding protein [Nitrospirota bacterium]HEW81389.1 phosphate/phosphite/phosphonate ABC transporter substrate-binding protein [Nitrospirota bacterium]
MDLLSYNNGYLSVLDNSRVTQIMSTFPYMQKEIRPVLIFLLFFVLILPSCVKKETPKEVSLYKRAGDTGPDTEHIQPNTLMFGFDLRLGPKEEVRIYTPFLKYLEQATGRRFRIKFTERYEDTIKNLGKGKTHFAAVGVLSYVIAEQKYGIKYLVSGINKEGDPQYHAAIIAAPDSKIEDLKDLKGKCFAFGAKMSTQGHLIPRKMLEDAGVTLNDLSQYKYTASHVNAVRSVLNGECDAAGIDNTLARSMAAAGEIKILKVSEPYPSTVIAYNTSLDKEIVEEIRSALIAFEPAGKHKSMLFDWDRTEMTMGFTKVDEP